MKGFSRGLKEEGSHVERIILAEETAHAEALKGTAPGMSEEP